MKNKVIFRFGIATAILYLTIGCESNTRVVPVKNGQERNSVEVAKELFDRRCLSAGEKIYRQVENVDGIFLIKLRPEKLNFSNQYVLDDPYGSDFTGDAYIRSFLRGFYESNYRKSENSIPNAVKHIGYRYVEAIDEKDKKRYRYVGIFEQPGLTDAKFLKSHRRFVLSRTVQDGRLLRYGVTYDDISTKEDRDHWIAGSSLKVIDLQTDEIIGERIGYMYDPAQGATVGGRSPWMVAASHSCPSFGKSHGSASQDLQTETFVGKVLKPSL